MNLFKIIAPTTDPIPIVISVPHAGTKFPSEIKNYYKTRMRRHLDDTDWYVHKLYDFAPSMGITIIKANLSRWVVDLNRDPKSAPLYHDGRLITSITPTTDFFGNKIYKSSKHEPDKIEIDRRLNSYYWPYYNQIETLLETRKKQFGRVLLWDAHSIRHSVSTIQKSVFPDMILGNNDEKTAHPQLIQTALQSLRSGPYGVNHNSPFKGGHITRYFGNPDAGIHTLQLEMNKILYMDDNEITYNTERASEVKRVLKKDHRKPSGINTFYLMKIYHLKGLLQATGWVKNVSIKLSSEGLIQEISQYDPTDKTIKIIDGYALPGFQNAHSHAFQYAMAGLAERHHHNGHQDDFWGWREAMYQLALGVDPDQMQSIATMLYSEMVRHGYTNVAEFHYVHHDPNGRPYNNLAEMGSRLIAAAETAGIGITLIPIFYQKGGFGQEPNDRQRRFISVALDDYLKLWEASKEACKCYKHATIGVGIHSMRGVEPAIIEEISKSGPQDVPFHIHVSEQLKEVEESLQYLGKRPVEWLLDHVDLNERFHLVHATHLTDKETEGIASSKANVVLCPSTEGNLGDGLFPLRNYQKNGGKWSIGTDSHIGLNPFEELRILDYGQRLTSHKRDSYTSEEQADSGMHAITMATTTGRRAMGNPNSKFFEVGQPLNAAIINASSPIIGATSEANLTSTMVYASDASMQLDTISHGKMVHNNQNQGDRQQIIQKFNTAIMALNNR